MRSYTLHETPRPGMRLGRHVHHDPASWAYPAPMASQIVSVEHVRSVPIFDQGDLGSCTGNAAAGCISTLPFAWKCSEKDAILYYEQATLLDATPGSYPPDDTGSSGLAVMAALHGLGLISGYTHAFDPKQCLKALVIRPGILGMTWLSGCDEPNEFGLIRYAGEVRGGHEVCLVGIDADKKLVMIANSWGADWGVEGYFFMTFDDLAKALDDNGDATFPLLPTDVPANPDPATAHA